MDHVTPEHWPVDLIDAANKLSDRLNALQLPSSDSAVDRSVALKELRDIVGWVPEVAADTDLAEGDWMKLYEASELARKKLLEATAMEPGLTQDIERLCSLLTEAQSLIPKSVEFGDSTNSEESAE